MNKSEIEDKISQIMSQNKPNLNKDELRLAKDLVATEIRALEKELSLSGATQTFSMNLQELIQEDPEQTFGSHKFTKKDYLIAWEMGQSKQYHFTLTNLTHKHKKLLYLCPDPIRGLCALHLKEFLSYLTKKQ